MLLFDEYLSVSSQRGLDENWTRPPLLRLFDAAVGRYHIERLTLQTAASVMQSTFGCLLVLFTLVLFPLVLVERGVADERQISFVRDVVPTLTKAGCNSGACHGTPTGKNGFRLSLRGYDTPLDLLSLTREHSGRRINLAEPEQSLVLLKATSQISHLGGRRFSRNGKQYRLVRDWIAQGARDDRETSPALVSLEVLPPHRVLEAPVDVQALQVVAHYADGVTRDVTALTRFSVDDERQAEVREDGTVRKLRRGEVTVSAEYMNDLASSKLVFLEPVAQFRWSNPSQYNYIDRHVFDKLKLLRIEPSGVASDEEFVRRVYLDTIGELPSPEEVRSFLASTSADKRARLIDDLLKRSEFADWWAMKWTDRLGCNQRFVGKAGAYKYHRWIRRAMEANVPEDEFVRAVLTSQGGNYSHPAAGFFRRLRDPQRRAEEVAQLFLGVRMQCAKCHNHPGERWTQDDYHGLAAFFARVNYFNGPFFNHIYDKEETVYVASSGEVNHPRTGARVPPKFLGGSEPTIDDEQQDRRQVLARWLTAPDNPFFAKASANRIWFHLFGRGIVEPVDDFRSSNPPSVAPLLAALAEDFGQHGFDRQHLIRTILNSRTYQLSWQTTPSNVEDHKYFSHANVRLLGAEQLLDAISTATGVAQSFGDFPAGMSAVSLPDGEYKHPFLEAFGRPARAMACECERDRDTNLTQALHLVGGRYVHDKLKHDGGRAAALARSSRPAAEIVGELFLATLCRFPSPQESRLLSQKIPDAGEGRREAVEDILWSLLNHNEFLFQH